MQELKNITLNKKFMTGNGKETKSDSSLSEWDLIKEMVINYSIFYIFYNIR